MKNDQEYIFHFGDGEEERSIRVEGESIEAALAELPEAPARWRLVRLEWKEDGMWRNSVVQYT